MSRTAAAWERPAIRSGAYRRAREQHLARGAGRRARARRLAVLMEDRVAVRLALPLALLLVTAVAVALIEGAPGRLPGVALGSEVLLHVERAAAIFAIVVAIASVLREALRGRLPTQLTTAGLAYEADVAAAEAAEHLQSQLDELRGQVQTLAELTLGGEEPRG